MQIRLPIMLFTFVLVFACKFEFVSDLLTLPPKISLISLIPVSLDDLFTFTFGCVSNGSKAVSTFSFLLALGFFIETL